MRVLPQTEAKCQAQLPAERILVMRYRFIGDTILTVPFLRNLRHAYPQAKIDVLVGPQSGTVLAGCPYIDELITFDTTNFHKYDRGKGKKRSFLSYAGELRARNYDLVFVLKRSFSSALLAYLSGAKYRVGYDTEYRGFLLSHKVEWRSNIHEVESTLDVLSAAGCRTVDDYLEAWVSEEEKKALLANFPELSAGKTKILFHAAAAHPDKVYPPESWAEIIRQLSLEGDILPCFTGAEQDRALYEKLAQLAGVPCLNLSGQLSLRQSIVLASLMDLAVCTDSGPAHLAAAAGTPVIALFGPTDPVRWRPWGAAHRAVFDKSLSCRPCNYKKSCNDERQCLTSLPPSLVLAEMHKLLRVGANSLPG